LNVKLKLIQEKALRQIIEVYRTTLTKVLQVKTNTILINIYLRKLIQKSITNIDLRELNKIITITMRRIRNNLILKRNRKLKLHKTSLQLKQK